MLVSIVIYFVFYVKCNLFLLTFYILLRWKHIVLCFPNLVHSYSQGSSPVFFSFEQYHLLCFNNQYGFSFFITKEGSL